VYIVVAATEGSRTLQVRLGGEGGKEEDGGGLSCMRVTVHVCMCMEWTTGPNAKT
jgi:hypothetical protein